MPASSLYISLNLAWLKSLGLIGFRLILAASGWFLGVGLFQIIFYNLLMYTNSFCFGYITLSFFLESFPGWLAGWLAGVEFHRNSLVKLSKTLSPLVKSNPLMYHCLGKIRNLSVDQGPSKKLHYFLFKVL